MAKDKEASVYFDYETHQFVGLTPDKINGLKEIYRMVDIETQLKKMIVWLSSAKPKRKGNIGFIMNWLSKCSPEIVLDKTTQLDSALSPLLDDYLKDLWKGREHILEFNKIKR